MGKNTERLQVSVHGSKIKHYLLQSVRRSIKSVNSSLAKAHHHAAHRPHIYLTKRLNWYRRWHEWQFHSHVHLSIMVPYTFAFVALFIFVHNQAFATNTYQTWNFSNSSDFVYNNATLETSDSSVRLKPQNYADDAKTAALYHFDEASGSTAADSSSHANNGTLLGDAAFTVGNLNRGLSLDGSSDFVRVPDSASLSLSQKNTLEAWTKFNNTFNNSSDAQRQTIIDKGDYQLYFDNETGKLAYELADKTADTWSLAGGNDVNGSWDANGKRSVNAIAKMGSDFYYGIGLDIGDAEVWKWNGSDWIKIGGGLSPVNNSWDGNTYEGVYSLATDGTNLYAGLGTGTGDGEVWKWNGTTWSKIGGDSLNSGWTNYAEQVWTLDYFGGNLYAGIGNTANDAEVWKWNGTSWTQIGGDSLNSGWTTNYEIVGAITNDGTNLYAGLGTTAGDGEVWKYNGTTWSKLGGDAISSGWDATIETIRSLRYLGGSLYAGAGDSAGDADVWKYNGTAWTQIGGDGVNSSWAASTYEQVGGFAWDGTNLYAGLGTGNGDGEVWRYNGTAWTQIGGDGLNSGWSTAQGDTVNTLVYDSGKLYVGLYDSGGEGLAYTWNGTSWTQIGGSVVNKSWGFYGYSAVQVMQSQGGYLYAGMGNTTGSAVVYRYDGSSWSVVGGQGINGSWAGYTYEQVMSMASYNGKLYVGLGTSANDAEVWEYNGSSWTQVGGDSLNSGWTTNYEEVSALAAYGGYLYAGLGSSAADGEVWRYNGTSWTKIGGDSLNSGWTNYAERVMSLAIYDGKLLAGLGSSAGDAEIWSWNGSAWTKIGGDTVNSSWNSTTYEDIESLMPYGGKLYAGLGLSSGDASVWEYNGSAWTQVGGDGVNNSWVTGTYEKVKTLVVYNGDVYAGLGNSAGDGEVWKYSGGSWTRVAGNSINNGWTNVVEEVESFSPYKGKLYAGTGLTANADALVWSLGNNAYIESDTSSFNTGWHHIAATYNGTTMKLFIDGALDKQKDDNVLLPDSSRDLLIGSSYGGREFGKATGGFTGKIDEVRISDDARTSFTSKPYSTTKQTITLANKVFTTGVEAYSGFITDESTNGGSIAYQLSNDDGDTWNYWNGTDWTAASSTDNASSASSVNSHIATFATSYKGLKWRAILSSDGNQLVSLNSVTVQATEDLSGPNAGASSVTAKKSASSSSLAQGSWTNGSSPYFSWDAGFDSGAGIYGYCLYLGQDNSADPRTTKGILGTSRAETGGNCQFITADNHIDLSVGGSFSTALTSSTNPYYLLVSAIDKAGNVVASPASFSFKFDNTPPSNPLFISVPSGFVNSKDVTITWPTSGGQSPRDDDSGLAGLQYKIGDGQWYGDNHTGSGDAGDLLENDGSYTTLPTPDFDTISDGTNTIYFRTWDTAGNVTSSYASAALKINTAGSPSEPKNLTATPATSTVNNFSFNWNAPDTFVGESSSLNYCYTINIAPSAYTCNYTGAGNRSLPAGAYATIPGANTLYVVAKDESGNINYGSYATTEFTANTTAPGLPGNLDIVDVSIKASEKWRLAITWDVPTSNADSVSNYRIYRSTDGTTFTLAGTSSSTTYIDAGLSQVTYYYRVTACDSTNNCSANSSQVSLLPTGKFTEAAAIVDEPKTSNITTKRATIDWATDRASDSRLAIGTSSGDYGASEIGSSDQVSIHSIDLDNLAAGTTYYYVVKWTDVDGNTGTSQEETFKTAPAPVMKEVTTSKVGLSNALVAFTSVNATKVKLYYGKSEGFGGLQTINTSTEESKYTIGMSGLEDGSKYYYQLAAIDSEGIEYKGNVFSFTTPERPRISELRFQPVKGEPTSTQSISWKTNVPTNSIITYGVVGTGGTDVQKSQMSTDHTVVISGLQDDSQYFLIAQGRDRSGNLVVSDQQTFKTALDTRPPSVSNVTIESSIRGSGSEARGQVIVSWNTDEPSTSQVGYAEGSTATVFNNKTSEDTQLTTQHIVVLSNLPTSKVYSIQVLSYDKARNVGTNDPQTAIIGRANESVLTLILNSLQRIFGL